MPQNTSNKRRAVTIHPPAQLVGEPKKTKKRKEGRNVVIHVKNDPNHVKCDPNRLRGYGAVGDENGPFLLLWPVAYTTACTTVQAVMMTYMMNRREKDFCTKYSCAAYICFALVFFSRTL